MSRPRTEDNAEVDEALATCREDLKRRFPLPEPAPARKPRTRGKAVSLVLLALVAGVAWKNPAYRNEHFVTLIGQRQSVQLADGSRIKLSLALPTGKTASRLEFFPAQEGRIEPAASQVLKRAASLPKPRSWACQFWTRLACSHYFKARNSKWH